MEAPSSGTPKTKPTHAYIIPYFKDDSGVHVLSGKERAVYEAAIRGLKLRDCDGIITTLNNQEKLLDESGQNKTHNIARNFSGVLLCGRTALPGGRIEKKETAEKAAVREFGEEFGFKGVTAAHLKPLKKYPLGSKRCEMYFLLDLDAAKIDPQHIIENFRRKPTTEKRQLAIVTPDELMQKLGSPDKDDCAHIAQEMKRFAAIFCRRVEKESDQKVSPEAEAKFTQDLIEYQLQRKFNSVNAAGEFKECMAKTLSIKKNVGQTMIPPPPAHAQHAASLPKAADKKPDEATLHK